MSSEETKNDDVRMEATDVEAKMVEILSGWMSGAANRTGEVQQKTATDGNSRLSDTSTQLESFSGDDGISASQWLERFEFSREIGNWSAAKSWSVILAKLTGQARQWHFKIGRELKTLDEWKAKFLEDFLPQQRMRKFVDHLDYCRQEYGEELPVYVWRSAAIAAQLGMRPDDMKGHILRGLSPEYECLVHELHGQTHNDIADLLKDIQKRAKFQGSRIDAEKDTPYQLNIRWQFAFGGRIPQKAVRGGYDDNGEVYYVARSLHNGAMVPGRAVATSRAAFIGYNGEEHMKRNFEVLVADCELEWIEYDRAQSGSKLPSGAIQGGVTDKGEPLYIGRAWHENMLTNGKIQGLEQFQQCLISFEGVEWTYDEFEVLACKTLNLA